MNKNQFNILEHPGHEKEFPQQLKNKIKKLMFLK